MASFYTEYRVLSTVDSNLGYTSCSFIFQRFKVPHKSTVHSISQYATLFSTNYSKQTTVDSIHNTQCVTLFFTNNRCYLLQIAFALHDVQHYFPQESVLSTVDGIHKTQYATLFSTAKCAIYNRWHTHRCVTLFSTDYSVLSLVDSIHITQCDFIFYRLY